MPPSRRLSSEQGYELARVGTRMGLPVDLQRLIWADVTKNYYSRGSVIDRAALVLQVAWRRLRAILSYSPYRKLVSINWFRYQHILTRYGTPSFLWHHVDGGNVLVMH